MLEREKLCCDKRLQAFGFIRGEHIKSCEQHPFWPINNIAAGKAIVDEEYCELQKAYNDYTFHGGKFEDLLTEAVQTGAMVVKFIQQLLILKERGKV